MGQIALLQENSSSGTLNFIPPKDLAGLGGNGNLLNKRRQRNYTEFFCLFTTV